MDIKLSKDIQEDILRSCIENAVDKLNKEIRTTWDYNSKCYIYFHADNDIIKQSKLTDYIPDNSWSLNSKTPIHYSYELYYDKDKGLLVLKLTDEYQEYLRYINDILPELIYKADKLSIESSNIRKYFDDSEVSIIHSNYIKFIKEYLL